MSEDLLTGREVATKLQLPERTLDQWRYTGHGPRFVKIGRHVRYRPSDLDAWLEDQAREPRGAA